MSPCQRDWDSFRKSLLEIGNLSFTRSIKPKDGDLPVLVIFSDGSKEAYGVVAYIRWRTPNGYCSSLLAAKSRIAPLKIIDTVRLELCGAVLNCRLYTFIKEEMRTMDFEKVYHIVDSEIVKAMINKESYGFNTFAANRLGEIHRSTEPKNWYWIEGNLNIADITTRGCHASELHRESTWQVGPDFMKLPESEWPVRQDTKIEALPERRKQFVGAISAAKVQASVSTEIDINRFSKLKLLLNTTARIMKLFKRFKKSGNRDDVDVLPDDLQSAEELWIKNAQERIHDELNDTKYNKLHPYVKDGILVVTGRTEKWMEATWNKQYFILLPKEDRYSYRVALHEHNAVGHLAASSTIAKIRSKYWIIGIRRIVNSIVSKCVKCKIKFKQMAQQRMSTLPIERIKPSPAFQNVGIDYFGPFATKGEVQKRVRGKGFGILITCDSSRAVYIDLAPDYSTPSLMLALRRFASFRGWPSTFHSDPGSQLKRASVQLQKAIKDLDWEELKRFGHQKGSTWSFAPADAKWYNGSTEALVKTVKKALEVTIGEHAFTFSEFLTIMFETAELVNERPIGRKPSDPGEGSYLCPNDLMLGRSTSRVPQGPFEDATNFVNRYKFIQSIMNNFWRRWSREIFPSLVIQPKWHVDRRNTQIGDVVLVQDSNLVRGEWKMALVSNILQSKDNRVRKVEVTYKRGSTSITVSRPVQKLIILVPKEDHQEEDHVEDKGDGTAEGLSHQCSVNVITNKEESVGGLMHHFSIRCKAISHESKSAEDSSINFSDVGILSSKLERSVSNNASGANEDASSELERFVSDDDSGANGGVISKWERSVSDGVCSANEDGISELQHSVSGDAKGANGVVISELERSVSDNFSRTNEDGSSELQHSVSGDVSSANEDASRELEHFVSDDDSGANGGVISKWER